MLRKLVAAESEALESGLDRKAAIYAAYDRFYRGDIAREIVLAGDMPDSVDAFSVSRACATSTQAVVSGAQSILHGDADIVVAGGGWVQVGEERSSIDHGEAVEWPPGLAHGAWTDGSTTELAGDDG